MSVPHVSLRRATAPPSANDAIVEAIRNVAVSGTPDRRALFNQLIVESILIVPMAGSPADGGATASVSVRVGRDHDGVWLPAFTSLEALHRWSPDDATHVAQPAPAICEMAEQNGVGRVVIDPGSDPFGILGSRDIAAIARGRVIIGATTELVGDERRFTFEVPTDRLPPEAVAAVREILASTPSVVRAFAASARQGDAAPEVAVVLVPAADVARGAREGITRSVAAAARERSASTAGWLFILGDDDVERALAEGAGAELYRR